MRNLGKKVLVSLPRVLHVIMTRIIVNAREKNRIGAARLTLNYGFHGHLLSAPTKVVIITEYIYVLQIMKFI